MSSITVIKQDENGREVVRYAGTLLEREDGRIFLEAFFSRQDFPFNGIMLKKGDLFRETFYTDRWYNIFELYDRDDGEFKGYYCNIGYPAVFDGQTLSYRDLALDLLVYPDGRQLVLDEDEFAALSIPQNVRQKALSALAELSKVMVKRLSEP